MRGLWIAALAGAAFVWPQSLAAQAPTAPADATARCKDGGYSTSKTAQGTVGEDEVRAWPIPRGTHARAAAGKIHSDLERGFIRAEVMGYQDFIAHGSEHAVKEAGKFKLEGKDYVVADGDIMSIRFNV